MKIPKIKKYLLLAGYATVILLAAGFFSLTHIKAQTTDNFPPLIQKLVEKFNLNQEEVQTVIDEHQAEIHQRRKLQLQDRLNEAVVNNEITEEQKQAILDKKEEFLNQKEEIKNLPPEDRHTAIHSLHLEIQKWAEENDIDFPLFFGTGKYRGSRHYHGFMKP